MSPQGPQRGWMGRVQSTIGNLAALAFRRPFLALAMAGLLTLAGAAGSKRLSLDADLSGLLPEDFQTVKDLEVLRERFGGAGYVVVVGLGEPEALRRFVIDYAPKLEKIPGIRFVDWKRETEFFTDRALYYLSLEDLQEVHRRLREREKWERRQRNPLLVKLDDEQPPPLDFSDILARYGAAPSSRLAGHGEALYLDPREKMALLLLKPERFSADLTYSKEIVGRVEQYLASQDLSPYGPGFRVKTTGVYKKKIDQQAQIAADVAWASSVAMVVMLLYLAFHFRSALAVGLVMAPVMAGLVWTYGMVGVAYGTVNLLTAFLGAILGGLGTEHGIHLLGRFTAERADGRSHLEAVRASFAHTGEAALISSLVAALTFLSLAISEFRAFREFGVIAAFGMVVGLGGYLLILPALLGLATRFGWEPKDRESVLNKGSPLAAWLPRIAKPVALTVGLGLAALLPFASRTSFDYDFGSLEDSSLESYALDRKVNRLLGYSQTPVVVFTATPEEERAVVDAFAARRAALGKASTIDFVAALDDLVPHDQEAKREVLEKIGAIVRKVDPEGLSGPDRERVVAVRRMAEAAPFTRADLPLSVRRQFEGVTQGPGGFVAVFPGVRLSDGTKIVALAQEVRGLELPGGKTVSATGEALILADIIQLVVDEAPQVLGSAIVLVLLAMWLTLRSLKDALVCMTPTLLSVACLAGLMPLAGLRFNFINMAAIPVLIGTTVDAGVHLVSRLAERAKDFRVEFAEVGRAICGGLLTSAVGFGAMVLADHPGLRSLGTLTVLGFSLNLVVMLLGFPAALLLMDKARREDEPATEPELAAVKEET